jgi:hypothetical protein
MVVLLDSLLRINNQSSLLFQLLIRHDGVISPRFGALRWKNEMGWDGMSHRCEIDDVAHIPVALNQGV